MSQYQPSPKLDTEPVLEDIGRWLMQLGHGTYSDEIALDADYDDTAILLDFADGPDEAIVLVAYGDDRGDHPEDGNTAAYSIQVISRSTPHSRFAAHRRADLIFGSLQHASAVKLPLGTFLLECHRLIRGNIDRDSAGRFFRADSYSFLLNPGDPE